MNHPEPVWILAVAAGVLATLLLGFGLGARHARIQASRGLWSEVAKRVGGKVEYRRGDFAVRFKWNGRIATIRGESTTVLEIPDGAFGPLEIEVAHAARLRQKNPAGYRLDDYQNVFVCPSDWDAARSFLTPAVGQLAAELLRLGRDEAEIRIGREFRVSGRPGATAKATVRFLLLALQIAQHARIFADRDSGVKVLQTWSLDSGECQICGAELEGTLVRCARCSTPHHADCWEYTGVCSTYGCGERTFKA